jgi:ribosomal protein S27AE
MTLNARFDHSDVTVTDAVREPLCPRCGNRLLDSLRYSTVELPVKQCNNCEVFIARDVDGRWARLSKAPFGG